MDNVGRVGLIAGAGYLPVQFATQAVQRGLQVMAVGVTPHVHPELAAKATQLRTVPITQWNQVIKALTSFDVRTVFLLGTVAKETLFSGAPMDDRFVSLVQRAKDGRDNELFYAFAADLESEGMTIGAQAELLPELLARPGILTRRLPSDAEKRDIAFAFKVAKQLAGLDIGQTVVVKQQAVLALEAIDGTNETLRRGARLGHGNVVAVKVAKPNQDMRFDVPAVGPDTVRAMAEAGVRVLAFEASRTLLLQHDETAQLADAADITLVALDPHDEEAQPHAHHDDRR